jgi:putative endonuclease
MKNFFVYILSSKTRVLYTGMTSNLERRLWQHKNGITGGFANKYRTYKLVYFEVTNSSLSAIAREKELKRWRREKKVLLIERQNPEWKDLSEEWTA